MIMDEKYIEARDRLIPSAERYADEETKKNKLPKKQRDIFWNKKFHYKMDALAKEQRLTP